MTILYRNHSVMSLAYRQYISTTVDTHRTQIGQFLISIGIRRQLPLFTQLMRDHSYGCRDKFSYNALMPRQAFTSQMQMRFTRFIFFVTVT